MVERLGEQTLESDSGPINHNTNFLGRPLSYFICKTEAASVSIT